jgi:hypothetical protein
MKAMKNACTFPSVTWQAVFLNGFGGRPSPFQLDGPRLPQGYHQPGFRSLARCWTNVPRARKTPPSLGGKVRQNHSSSNVARVQKEGETKARGESESHEGREGFCRYRSHICHH